MKFIEVTDIKLKKEFIQFPVRLYKNVENWIRPIDNDIEDVFDKKKNKFFRHGECIRWIVADDSGNTIGRVAAFIDRKNEKQKNSLKQEMHVGGMGFFESIEDEKVAIAIFYHCKNWLISKGMNAMDGPINFGERDNWWGLLIEGFDIEPNYKMPYTMPYYKAYFENYGFKEYFNQLTFGRKVLEPLHENIKLKSDRITKDPLYTFEQLDKKRIEKYTEDFRTIYNLAWVNHAGVKKMNSLQAKSIMKQMKPILDPDVILFAYYDKIPVGFFFNLPEVNQIIKYLDGKLNWLGKLKFLYHKMIGTNKKLVGRGFGIVPDHQGKGVEAAIVEFSRQISHEQIRGRYIDYEMNWIGDFNPKMVRIAEQIGGIVKKHRTYRILFDDSIEFERCPEIK